MEVVNVAVYIAKLAAEDRMTADDALSALARMILRGTLRSEWIIAAMRMIAQIRERKDSSP